LGFEVEGFQAAVGFRSVLAQVEMTHRRGHPLHIADSLRKLEAPAQQAVACGEAA